MWDEFGKSIERAFWVALGAAAFVGFVAGALLMGLPWLWAWITG